MGKINGCLKCLFIFFNVLFMIIGALLIYAAVKATAQSLQLSTFGGPNLGWSWMFAIGVLAISCLGIYAACSEKPIALKIFAGFMGVGMVIMLIFGIIVVVTRNKVKDNYHSLAAELSKTIMEDESLRTTLEQTQKSVQCCGVVRAEDWGNDIPDSCACHSFDNKCTSIPQGARGPSQIYKLPCSEVVYQWLNLFFLIAMGVCFAFAVTALMGLLISILMIHQVKRHDNVGTASIAMRGY